MNWLWANRRRKAAVIIVSALVFLMSLFTIMGYLVVSNNKSRILDEAALPEDTRVALVPGGGINAGNKPTDVIIARLDAAANLYRQNKIEKILVSGDNRFTDYNEPQVMQDYLIDEAGIPLESIQQDNAGRSTYESCERAKDVFQLNSVVIVSQRSHLPRAIYLCRSFGIDAYGYPAVSEHARVSQSVRELGANLKALYNVYIRGENTVKGDPIPL